MAALALAILTRPAVERLAPFFLERALPEGGGHNVVNVILVDFRGFDTMGEITVLGAVALTVYALLRRFRPAPESRGIPRGQREDAARDALTSGDGLPADSLRIPAAIARMLLRPWAPTMTWSCTVTFMCRPASTRSRVSRMSWLEGVGSPLG